MMGLVYATVTMSNPRHPDLEPLEIEALADTGAVHLSIPEHVQHQLNLDVLDEREITLADGSRRKVPYVGPLQLRFANRTGLCGALVLGDEVLFGVVPMEDMDLVVIPGTRTLAVNPENPNLAHSLVK